MLPGGWENCKGGRSRSHLLCSASSGISEQQWRPFGEARDFARGLGVKSKKDWFEWCMTSGERPRDIPVDPSQVYGGEGGPWQGWPDFLGGACKGSGSRGSRWLPFEEARDHVWTLGLKNQKEWKEWRKSGERPSNIPSTPDRYYKDEGWLSWGDFLGFNEGYVAGEYLPFEEARGYVWTLGLKSVTEWREWIRSKEKPQDIPSKPFRVYKGKGWLSWPDFLGYKKGYVTGEWRPFDEARDYVSTLGLKSKEEWWEWNKSGERPSDIPFSINTIYKDEGWKSWGDFLGYRPGYDAKKRGVAGRKSFMEAREYVRSLGLKSVKQWQEWSKRKRPQDIPSAPEQFYKEEGWLSWPDFLGYNEGYVTGEYLPFEEARDYVWTLGLKSQKEWWEWSKSRERPQDIPSSPDQFYKDKGWLSWGDFLGFNEGYVAGEYLPFEEAREYVWTLGLKSVTGWREWIRSKEKPQDIPSEPFRVYKGKGWLSWPDFLGYKKGYVTGEWRDFEEAREYARSLGLKSKKAWNEWDKSGERPHDIPCSPDRTYKNKGWLNWGDFLGF